MAQNQSHPTPEEVAGAIAEARRAVYDRGRSTVGAILKVAVNSDYLEATDRLLTTALENIQDLVERTLLRTFSDITHEQVMAAHRALLQAKPGKSGTE